MKNTILLASTILVVGVNLVANLGCGSKTYGLANSSVENQSEEANWLQSDETFTMVELDRTYFKTDIQPMFEAHMINGSTKGCLLCHDMPFAHSYDESVKKVVPGHPEESELYIRATGGNANYKHQKIWASDSPEALKLIYWINGNK